MSGQIPHISVPLKIANLEQDSNADDECEFKLQNIQGYQQVLEKVRNMFKEEPDCSDLSVGKSVKSLPNKKQKDLGLWY